MFALVAFSLRKAQKWVLLFGKLRLETMRPSKVDMVQPPLTMVYPAAQAGEEPVPVELGLTVMLEEVVS